MICFITLGNDVKQVLKKIDLVPNALTLLTFKNSNRYEDLVTIDTCCTNLNYSN